MSVLAQMHEEHVARQARLWRPVLVERPKPVLTIVKTVSTLPKPKRVRATSPQTKWRTILSETAEKHGVTVDEIVGDIRTKKVVPARHEAAFRMATEADMSLPAIGRRLNRDHTSIIHAIRRHMENNPDDAPMARESTERRQAAKQALRERALQMLRDGMSFNAIRERLPVSFTYVRGLICELAKTGCQEGQEFSP